MPSTSSYRIPGQPPVKNITCFAFAVGRPDFYIIIEPEKYAHIGLKTLIHYLTVLQSFNLGITEIKHGDKGVIEVRIQTKSVLLRRFLVTAIRCVWEGIYGSKEDQFYLILRPYLNLVERNKEVHPMILLCYMATLFSDAFNYYNSNHFFVYQKVVATPYTPEELKEIAEKEPYLNSAMDTTDKKETPITFITPEEANSWKASEDLPIELVDTQLKKYLQEYKPNLLTTPNIGETLLKKEGNPEGQIN